MAQHYLIDETVQMIKWYNTIIYNCNDIKLKQFFEDEKELVIRSHKEHCEKRRPYKSNKIIKMKSIEEALDQVTY